MNKYEIIMYACLSRLGIIRKQQDYKDCKTLLCQLSIIAIDFISVGAFLLLCFEFISILFSTKTGNLTTNGQWILGSIFIIVACFSPVEFAALVRRKLISILFKENKEIQDELTKKEDGKSEY